MKHGFKEFEKMPRLKRTCWVTEKIDGTNGQISITPTNEEALSDENAIAHKDGFSMFAGSRSRWITPTMDNYGFAGWVFDNHEELFKLGEGRHFGEWWGSGIQRRYDLTGSDKRFSLFNADRWKDGFGIRPTCCSVVPTIFVGQFTTDAVDDALNILRDKGSFASPGFMNPEGIIVYLVAARSSFKVTLEKDDQPKSMSKTI